jgi:DNA-binding IclR family transcriptional regulator
LVNNDVIHIKQEHLMADTNYFIPAVARATQLLEHLSVSHVPLGVSELSRELKTNKNMVFRLLRTLQEQGWIVQEEGPKYRVSLRPFCYLSQPVQRMGIREAAAAPLRQLWEETGEACYLAILDDDRCLFVEHLDSTREVRAQGRVGGRYQLHYCAPGKVLLAHAGHKLIDRVLAGQLEQNTAATISSREELRRELARVVDRGYALDLEEYCRGMMCLAAPVVDADGQISGALGITVLTIYYTQAELVSVFGPKVLRAAAEASENLGLPPTAIATRDGLTLEIAKQTQ